MPQITLADINRWRSYINGTAGGPSRTNFYVEYFELTGLETILDVSSISTFSGGIGGAANVGNFLAMQAIALEYDFDYPPIADFSQRVAQEILDEIESRVVSGQSGTLTDLQVLETSRTAWIEYTGEYYTGNQPPFNLAEYFPGNTLILFEAAKAGDPESRYFGSAISTEELDQLQGLLVSAMSGDGEAISRISEIYGAILTDEANDILFSESLIIFGLAGATSANFGFEPEDYYLDDQGTLPDGWSEEKDKSFGSLEYHIIMDENGKIVYVAQTNGIIAGVNGLNDFATGISPLGAAYNYLRDKMVDAQGGEMGTRPPLPGTDPTVLDVVAGGSGLDITDSVTGARASLETEHVVVLDGNRVEIRGSVTDINGNIVDVFSTETTYLADGAEPGTTRVVYHDQATGEVLVTSLHAQQNSDGTISLVEQLGRWFQDASGDWNVNITARDLSRPDSQTVTITSGVSGGPSDPGGASTEGNVSSQVSNSSGEQIDGNLPAAQAQNDAYIQRQLNAFIEGHLLAAGELILGDLNNADSLVNFKEGSIWFVFTDGEFVGIEYQSSTTDEIQTGDVRYSIGSSGQLIIQTQLEEENGVGLTTTYDSSTGETVYEPTIGNTSISVGALVGVFGSTLGRQLGGSNEIAQLATGTLVGTLADNLAETLALTLRSNNAAIGAATEEAFRDFGDDLSGATVGAVSSFLTAELINAVGLDGFAGGVANTLGGQAIGNALNQVVFPGNGAWNNYKADIASGEFASVGSALGSFLGGRLAGELVTPRTIEEQIGFSIGAGVGGVVASSVAGSVATSLQIQAFWAGLGTGTVLVAIGAVAGKLIADAFSTNSPESGIVVYYDTATGQYTTLKSGSAPDGSVNWKDDNGSLQVAQGMAEAAASAFNGVLATMRLGGGELLNANVVDGAAWGQHNVESEADRGLPIKFRYFSDGEVTSSGATTLQRNFERTGNVSEAIGGGVGYNLSNMAFIGGDLYARRAFYANVSNFDLNNPEAYDASSIIGDFAIAADYAAYLENAAIINFMIAINPQSAFSAGWAITLQRADEMGLNQYGGADLLGGLQSLLPFEMAEGTTFADVSVAFADTNEGGADKDVVITIADQSQTISIEDFATTMGFREGISSSNSDIRIHNGTDGVTFIDANTGSPTGSPFDSAGKSLTSDDIFVGGSGNDNLQGRYGWDWLDGGAGDDMIDGGDGNDVLLGRAGADQLDGGSGDDTLADGAGADIVDGGSGADVVLAADDGTADTFDGGSGKDAVSYANWVSGVTIDMNAATQYSDTYVSIENVTGTDFGDAITGDGAANLLSGLSGDDTLSGGDGDDTLMGGVGADSLVGSVGTDTASYKDAAGGVIVDLLAGQGTGGDADGDSYSSIENLEGSEFADNLKGDGGDNRISGLGGNDVFAASAGNNTYDGGDGLDIVDYSGATQGVVVNLQSTPGSATGGPTQSSKTSIPDPQPLSAEPTEKVAFSKKVASAKTISGSSRNDTIIGGSGDDVIKPGGGDDVVWAGRNDVGDDFIDGGSGNDELGGGDGDDTINGGVGDDIIYGGAGNDVVNGESGDDLVYGSSGFDTVRGGSGNDELYGGVDDDIIQGESGNDLIYGTAGNNIISGGSGNDSMFGGSGSETFFASTGDDFVSAGGGNDIVYGGAGHDVLFGEGGNDLLLGGDESDTLDGGDGNDEMYGSPEDDQLADGTGRDTVRGGEGDDLFLIQRDGHSDIFIGDTDAVQTSGNDTAWFNAWNSGVTVNLTTGITSGEQNNNTLSGIENLRLTGHADHATGDSHSNRIEGENGNDTIEGMGGFDSLEGDEGNDLLRGGAGNDRLMGDEGDDLLEGGSGEDRLIGDDGNDTLVGEDGNDWLEGATGDDQLAGGTGDDWYVFSGNWGTDVIVDFELGNDVIIIASGGLTYADLTITASGPDSRITVGSNSITVKNILPGELTSEHFSFSIPGSGTSSDDVIQGTSADEAIWARGGDDIVNGGGGNDTIGGAAGNDTLRGGAGNDIIFGDIGDDSINGGTGGDTLFGGDDLDVLDGGSGDDQIWGSKGNDTIIDGSGKDIMTGREGDDRFELVDDGEKDLVYGEHWENDPTGESVPFGRDIVSFRSWTDAVNINLTDAHNTQIGFEGNVFFGIDDLELTNFSDWAEGDQKSNLLWGLSGDDTLFGGSGHDTLQGGSGTDYLAGGDGDDKLVGGSGDDVFGFDLDWDHDTVTDFQDSLDRLDLSTTGLTFEQLTLTSNGNDTEISDGNGNVITLSDVDVSRISEADFIFQAGEDRYVNVEGVIGSAFADVIYGSSTGSWFEGGGGDDSLTGGSGNDTFVFAKGDGVDTIIAGAGHDTILLGNNVSLSDLYLTSTLSGALITTSLTLGRNGSDSVEMTTNSVGGDIETIALSNGHEINLSSQTVVDGELVTRGLGVIWNGNETGNSNSLVGSRDNIWLSGWGGDDILKSGFGNDVLTGGTGADRLEGNFGNDSYLFSRGDGHDVIRDIGGAGDVLVLDEGIIAEDLSFSLINGADGSKSLKIEILSGGATTGDSITIEKWNDQNQKGQVDWIYVDGAKLNLSNLIRPIVGNSAPEADAEDTWTATRDSSKNQSIGAIAATDVDGDKLSFRVVNVVGAGAGESWWFNGHSLNTSASYFSSGASLVEVEITDGLEIVTQNLRINWTSGASGGGTVGRLPIVFDLDGDGVELISVLDSDVYFDADADGQLERTGWVGADDGLLVLDRNRDGLINDISEISFVQDLDGATTDLEGLAAFDKDEAGQADGVIDANDTTFGLFQIWRDSNSDGTSQSNELFGLPDLGITSISLTIDPVGQILDGNVDNVITGQSTYTTESGTVATIGDVTLFYDDGVGLDLKPIVETLGISAIGGAGNDTLTGGLGNDTLDGRGGNDILQGGFGDDSLIGDVDNDTLQGGAGNDTIRGSAGLDLVAGGSGDDNLTGGSDADTFVFAVNWGVDTITDFVKGEDTLDLESTSLQFGDLTISQVGADTSISTIDGNLITLSGVAANTIDANDFVFGLPTSDIIGTPGNDSLTGTVEPERLFGLGGNDTLLGNNGADTLDGGVGDDLLTGGSGSDTLVFGANWGADTISDFVGGEDKIDLTSTPLNFNDLTITQVGGDTLISEPDGNTITLTGIDATTITESDFLLLAATVDIFKTNDNTPTVTGTVADPSATISVTVDGVDYAGVNNGDGTWSAEIANTLVDNTYDVALSVTGSSGAVSHDTTVAELTIDTVVPIATITSLTTSDTTPLLTGTVDDPEAVITAMVNGVDYAGANNSDGTWSAEVTTVLADGSYVAEVTVTDAAGNTASYGRNNGQLIERTGAHNPLDSVNVVHHSKVTLVDIDGDGDLDAFFSGHASTIYYYENTGTVSSPVFLETTGADNPFNGVDVGNKPRVTFEDIDQDGDLDAFVGSQGGKIYYYVNVGTTMTPVFSEVVGVDNPFNGVDVGSHANIAFADLDGDGDLDAFLGENTGIINYYENIGISANPVFTQVNGIDNPFNGVDVGAYSNMAFSDFDSDGDLDAFLGGHDGIVNYYENTGTDDSPAFSEITGIDNPFNGIDVNPLEIHGWSNIEFADIDGNGTQDVFLGGNTGLINYYESVLTPNLTIEVDTTAPIATIDTLSTSDATPMLTGTVDDPDAIITATVNGVDYAGVNNGDGTWSAEVTTILATGSYVAEVTATDTSGNTASYGRVEPTWAETSGAGNPFNGVDIGSDVNIAFMDRDGDGDLDAFIGAADGTINFYENTGSDVSPIYVEVTGAANPFNSVDVGDKSKITFADLDGDGDLDAFINEQPGVINYFENTGTPASAIFTEIIGSISPLDGIGAFDGLRTVASPGSSLAFVDIDGDGDLDAFLGKSTGDFSYFENTGSATSPNFTELSGNGNPLDRVNSNGIDISAYTNVAFTDSDGDGDLDAFIGEAVGQIRYFENTGTISSPVFQEQTGLSNPFNGVDIDHNSVVTFADLDGNGTQDAFIGEFDGFINYFEAAPIDNLIIQEPDFNTVTGTSGADTLAGTDGNDRVQGLAGNDMIIASEGSDTLVGGDGIDTVSYVAASTGIMLDFHTMGMGSGLAAGDGFIDIENVEATQFDDQIYTNSANNTVHGFAGADLVDGREGDDWLYGGAENDTLIGGQGNDLLNGGIGDDNLMGGANSDSFVFDAGWGSDIVTDFAIGEDILDLKATGLQFVDLAITQVGPDTQIEDGDGNTITLSAVSASTVTASAFVFASSLVTGTTGDDNLTGTVFGDLIEGLSGSDTISGGDENDTLDGGEDADVLRGEAGNDILDGGVGNDSLEGGAGADTLDGGPGDDRAEYQGSAAAVSVNLATGQGFGGDAESDVLTGVEAVSGSMHNDTLTGGAADDTLHGESGADQVIGDAGNDYLYGGAGADTIDGGDGDDIFAFGAGWGTDTITDFVRGEDVLDLKATGLQFGDLTITDVTPLEVFGAFHYQVSDGSGNSILVQTVTDGLDASDFVFGSLSIVGTSANEAITGGSGDDYLNGGGGNDTISGGWGDDSILGNAGDDLLDGGSGDDTLRGQGGDDTLVGGEGNNVLDSAHSVSDLADYSWSTAAINADLAVGSVVHATGVDTLHNITKIRGTESADTVRGADSTSWSRVYGGGGNDVLIAGDHTAYFHGETGDDVLTGGIATDYLYGDEGADTIHGGGGGDSIYDLMGIVKADGGAGNDYFEVNLTGGTVSGGGGADHLLVSSDTSITFDMAAGTVTDGFGNNIAFDSIESATASGMGNHTLLGSNSDETLRGGYGHDLIMGGAGNDYLRSALGNDTLIGGDGDDILDNWLKDSGNEWINQAVKHIDGGTGTDSYHVLASPGSVIDLGAGTHIDASGAMISLNNIENVILNTFFFFREDSVVRGSAGANQLNGGGGNDTLIGGDGDDSLLGQVGDDSLQGGDGNDILGGITEAGNDTIDGGDGNDTLTGSTGNDTFTFGAGWGTDTITDYVHGEDMLDLKATGLQFADLTISQVGPHTEITEGGGNKIVLENINATDVTASDFVFASTAPKQAIASPPVAALVANDQLAVAALEIEQSTAAVSAEERTGVLAETAVAALSEEQLREAWALLREENGGGLPTRQQVMSMLAALAAPPEPAVAGIEQEVQVPDFSSEEAPLMTNLMPGAVKEFDADLHADIGVATATRVGDTEEVIVRVLADAADAAQADVQFLLGGEQAATALGGQQASYMTDLDMVNNGFDAAVNDQSLLALTQAMASFDSAAGAAETDIRQRMEKEDTVNSLFVAGSGF